ncbi:uncharacterized protein FFB14_06426 [Fusarium fujikuroi]|nr:uncharacterized protein FFB14_06426 [Fusarium fujikuroi]
MFSAQNCGFQEARAHVPRGNEIVDLDEGIVCPGGYVDLAGNSPKDTVQRKRANKVQSYRKARKNDPSTFSVRPAKYWSKSNTRLIPLAPKYPPDMLRNQKTQFSEQHTANHIHPDQASSHSLRGNLLSSRNIKDSTSNCLRDRKSERNEIATSSNSPQLHDQRDPSVRHMKKEIKRNTSFSSGQPTQTTTKAPKRRAQDSTAPPKKTRKTKSHIGIDETDSDGDVFSGSGEVDTSKKETFACPFYRRDPVRFLECINTRLVTIAIVKQHLRRRHGADSRSPVGQKGSRSLDKVEDNVREQDKIGSLDTIPPHILDDLKIRSDRRTSSTAQWHQIWILLFGESKFIPNPLLNGLVKEITGMIRDIWSKEGGQIVSNYLHTRGIPLNSGQLLSLLPELLDKVDGRFENKPDDSDEQHAGVESPPLETTIGGTDSSHKNPETLIQYPYPELDPSDLILFTRSNSMVCDSPQPISGVQVPHDFASVGGAFESQANSSEHATADFSNIGQLLCMDAFSPVDDPCDIIKEDPLSEMARPQFHPDWHGSSDNYYFKFLEE